MKRNLDIVLYFYGNWQTRIRKNGFRIIGPKSASHAHSLRSFEDGLAA